MRMMTTLAALLIAAPLLAQSREQGSYDPQRAYDVKEATRVATAALPALRSLAEQLPAVVGLKPDEVASAELGAPLAMFDVPLDRLKEYQAGSDPTALLTDVHTVHVPVLVGGAVRSSIVVKQKGGSWVATDFGQVELSRRIAEVRGGATQAVLVRVPALNDYFVGTTSGGALTLTPIADVAGTDFRQGQSVPAAAVFAALAAQARQSNGLPT
jgi:hypothetical protein